MWLMVISLNYYEKEADQFNNKICKSGCLTNDDSTMTLLLICMRFHTTYFDPLSEVSALFIHSCNSCDIYKYTQVKL